MVIVVVLPAPFGPSSATVCPRPTLTVTSSTAHTGPKDRETPSTFTASVCFMPSAWGETAQTG
jgi:hypothetical protein